MSDRAPAQSVRNRIRRAVLLVLFTLLIALLAFALRGQF